MSELDRALADLAELRDKLAVLAPDDPRRAVLEQRRDDIHRRARAAADRVRSDTELRRELEEAQRRLRDLDEMRIDPSFTERRMERWPIGNPTGYAQKINAAIDANTRSERDALVERIAELASILSER